MTFNLFFISLFLVLLARTPLSNNKKKRGAVYHFF